MLRDYFSHIEFSQPYILFGLILVPLLIVWYIISGNRRNASIVLSTTAGSMRTFKTSMRHLPFILRMLCMSCLIVALANPQTRNREDKTEGEGFDIVLCIDVSGSMTAQDLQPNRLEAAKAVAVDFIKMRPTDRLGIVIFSGESFTQCPLTTDRAVLTAAVQNVRNGLLEDGTAIGSGLSTAVDRLRSSTSKTKIAILLTDGENNGGLIDPKTAKEIAKAFGVKVYTIGVGSEGTAPQPVQTDFGVQIQNVKVSIDEKLLTEIATETGGQYFRARDNNALQQIYATIDRLEKSKIEVVTSIRYEDKYLPFAIAAAFFLLLEMILRYLVFRKFP